MSKKNILIIIIVVAVLLLGYFFILDPNETTDVPEEEVVTEIEEEGDVLGVAATDLNLDPQLVLYSNPKHGFSFVYPDALFDLEETDEGARLNHHEMAFDFIASEGEALNENEVQLFNGKKLTMTDDYGAVEKLPEDVRLKLFNQIYLTIAAQ